MFRKIMDCETCDKYSEMAYENEEILEKYNKLKNHTEYLEEHILDLTLLFYLLGVLSVFIALKIF